MSTTMCRMNSPHWWLGVTFSCLPGDGAVLMQSQELGARAPRVALFGGVRARDAARPAAGMNLLNRLTGSETFATDRG